MCCRKKKSIAKIVVNRDRVDFKPVLLNSAQAQLVFM